MSQPYQPVQSIQSDNWVHISVKPGEKPLFDARGEGVDELRRLVDGVLGDGALNAYVHRFHADILDGGVQMLQNAGLAASPQAPAPSPAQPSFVPAGTPQATFPAHQGGGSNKVTLGQHDGHSVVLWKDGKFGPNVLLDGYNGPDGKTLRSNLAKGENPDGVTLDRAVQLLSSRFQYLSGKQG